MTSTSIVPPAAPAWSDLTDARGLDPQSIRVARRSLSLLGLLSAGSLLGVTFSLYLVNHYPLLLVVLSPIDRHLVLVAPSVHPVAFIAVAGARRMLFYVPCYFLGRSLGETGISWLEARAGWAARLIRWLRGVFDRASYAAVLLLPGASMSAIAGMSNMRGRTFAVLTSLGLLLRMLLVVALAEWLRGPIEDLLGWIERIWLPGTAVMLTGVLLFQSWRRRRSASC